MPKLYIIAGCNGAGKTTASYTVLPEMLDCREFVNADEIAKGLSPFNPESVAIAAGRLLLQRMDDLLIAMGYFVSLLFFWLPTPELAIVRVATRVSKGGHDIPEEVIRRRYATGMRNMVALYAPLCDYWVIYDNSSADAEIRIIATGENNTTKHIENPLAYQQFMSYERN